MSLQVALAILTTLFVVGGLLIAWVYYTYKGSHSTQDIQKFRDIPSLMKPCEKL
ncbi:MAG: hypothetical protein ACRESZ_18645 [Methylococcales bacterium]